MESLKEQKDPEKAFKLCVDDAFVIYKNCEHDNKLHEQLKKLHFWSESIIQVDEKDGVYSLNEMLIIKVNGILTLEV